MCGIVVALPTYDEVGAPRSTQTLLDALPAVPTEDATDQLLAQQLTGVGKAIESAVELFRSGWAVRLLAGPDTHDLQARLAELQEWSRRVEQRLDASVDGAAGPAVEAAQAALRGIRDQLFTIERDGIAAAGAAWALTAGAWTERSSISYAAIATALDVIDRLEVRGRDSAGVGVWVELDAADRPLLDTLGLDERVDPLLLDGSVLRTPTGVCFVYKRAAIIGRLGDNTAHLRAGLRADAALHTVLALPSAAVTVLAHTRWASVGRTSVSNAHPVDNARPGATADAPVTIAVLNGDVDNYLALGEELGYHPDPAGVTTDAKLIPLLVSDRLRAGRGVPHAVTDMLDACSGSMAIALQSADTDGDVHLAVKGSGQSLYVGLGPRGYLVASEIYGLVGQTQQFFRVEGTEHGAPAGKVVRLTRAGAGRPEYVEAWNAAGDELPPVRDLQVSEVTSRDLARGGYEHFIDKELHDAPESFKRTLRGRVVNRDGRLTVALPESSLPEAVRARLAGGAITEVLVVGQGTAAVAAQGIAHVIGAVVGKRLAVTPQLATEFSAWRLRRDMSDTLVVAVSQSGSTTDTNRAVDLARERGAAVIAIVNRRESDLAHKSDGVVYTSDGRDVELSVASTKAFYSQIAAGSLLGLALGRVLDVLEPELETSLISSLVALPAQLSALLGDPDVVRDVARAVATRYANWAVVGSGPNRVSANEVRIKLSELCYRTVAVDAVEDKKHIDLSAESLVLVCAAGAPPNQLHDLAKEVEIFKAHNNRAVVICDADTVGMWSTDLVIPIPSAHPTFAWVLGTAAGHLFSYHAAQAIDATAQPLRRALEELEHLVDAGRTIGRTPPAAVAHPIDQVLTAAADGDLRGVLSSTATMGLVRIVAGSQLGAAAGAAATSGVDEVRAGLETAIEELTRSIDTIKHQAKTVTVGTSRNDADLYDNLLVEAMRAAGTDVLTLNLPVLDVLRSLAPVVRSASGVTRYSLDWTAPDSPRAQVVGKFGSAADLASRADHGAPLSGSKRRVAELALPRLVLGRADSRVVVIVPEQLAGTVHALSLVHVELQDAAPAEAARRAVETLGERAEEIVAAITETAPDFSLDSVWTLAPATLLLEPLDRVVEEALAAGRA